MEPAKKAPEIDALLTTIFGYDRQATIRGNQCVPAPIGCGRELDVSTEFRDALSAKEYTISGLCQRCQDTLFGKESC